MERVQRKRQIMALWRKCFIDSERYIKLFLNTFYSPSNVVTIERDGQVLAFLFLLSMPVKFYTREVRASYIYAVCTHPQFRRQGLMKELMEKAFKKARRRGDRFLFLVPADKWLSDVYQRMGFREAFFVKNRQIHLQSTTFDTKCISEAKSANTVYSYLRKKWETHAVSVLHSAKEIRFDMIDFRVENGGCYLYKKDKKVVGFIMAFRRKDTLYIRELQADTPEIENELLAFVSLRYGGERIYRIHVPVLPSEGRPFGLVRVVSSIILCGAKDDEEHAPFIHVVYDDIGPSEQVRLLFNNPPQVNCMNLMML